MVEPQPACPASIAKFCQYLRPISPRCCLANGQASPLAKLAFTHLEMWRRSALATSILGNSSQYDLALAFCAKIGGSRQVQQQMRAGCLAFLPHCEDDRTGEAAALLACKQDAQASKARGCGNPGCSTWCLDHQDPVASQSVNSAYCCPLVVPASSDR